jgi:thiamine transport system ATP-binding protein
MTKDTGLIVNSLAVVYPDWRYTYNLEIEAGARVALLGESGIGKTTLLLALAGFAPIESGQVIWQDQNITHNAANQRPIAMLFQADNLFEHLSVRSNLLLGQSPKLDQQRVIDGAKHLGIDKQLDKMPAQLSGGQRQRVAILRTLLRDEPLVILDEPFTGLDETTKARTLAWIDEQLTRDNKTLLMVTHQQEDATALNARVASI